MRVGWGSPGPCLVIGVHHPPGPPPALFCCMVSGRPVPWLPQVTGLPLPQRQAFLADDVGSAVELLQPARAAGADQCRDGPRNPWQVEIRVCGLTFPANTRAKSSPHEKMQVRVIFEVMLSGWRSCPMSDALKKRKKTPCYPPVSGGKENPVTDTHPWGLLRTAWPSLVRAPPRPSPDPLGFPGEGTPPHARFLPTDASLQWTPGPCLALSWPVSWAVCCQPLRHLRKKQGYSTAFLGSEAQKVSNVSVVTTSNTWQNQPKPNGCLTAEPDPRRPPGAPSSDTEASLSPGQVCWPAAGTSGSSHQV